MIYQVKEILTGKIVMTARLLVDDTWSVAEVGSKSHYYYNDDDFQRMLKYNDYTIGEPLTFDNVVV